jgi:hypothetical protein
MMDLRMNLLKLATAFMLQLFWIMGYVAWDGVICCERGQREVYSIAHLLLKAWSIRMTVLCFERRKNMEDDAEG